MFILLFNEENSLSGCQNLLNSKPKHKNNKLGVSLRRVFLLVMDDDANARTFFWRTHDVAHLQAVPGTGTSKQRNNYMKSQKELAHSRN